VVVLEKQVVFMPEVDKDGVIGSDLGEIGSGFPFVLDLGDQVVGQGLLGKSDLKLNALDLCLFLARG